ncbi:MAG: ABC transporter substrate-binding protein [Ferruginibacter sp.]|nr:ABC transporter substrate-binding protein [Ferruginibacter sp.]
MNNPTLNPVKLLCAFFLLVIFSCNDHRHPDKNIFHYNQADGIASLDPAFSKNQSVMWAIHQLYNTLVEVEENLKVRPALAKSWEFSRDHLAIVFHLRNDVFFHNDAAFKNGIGRKLTAADVVFSFERLMDRNTASPGSWIFNSRVDSTLPFQAVNDSTFRIQLLKPFQPILGMLSMQYCSVVAKEAVVFYGKDFRRHPVGTGPFLFTVWEEGQALILKKNNYYFEKDSSGYRLPYLDGIKVSFYASKATEFLEFQQQRLDFINDIDASFKDEILSKTGNLKKEWQGKLLLDKHSYLNIEYLGILADTANPLIINSPLRFTAVRQAINYGIDRRKMILYLRNSIGTAAESGFVPPGLPSYNNSLVKGYSYDPAKSKRLLAEAGYDNNNMPEIKLLTIPNYAALGTYIVNELKQLGINASVETVQKSLLLEQTSKSQVPFFRGSWIADYPDAENYLGVFYSKNPAPPNYTRYHNKLYDLLYERSLGEENDSVRYDIYRQMDRMIIHDAPVIPLWYDMVLHLVHTNIQGFTSNSLNMLELRRVKKFR